MRVLSDDRESYIEMIPVEYESQHLPSVSLMISISASSYGHLYSASNPTVWFTKESLKKFISDLNLLDASRQGAATLQSMSPNECEISIFAFDHRGHVAIKLLMSKPQFGTGQMFQHHLETGFELDPTELLNIIRGFKGLLQPISTS
ncbi:hypothetical protein [Alicyclobacillus sp. SO9]|uniref:WapI family immunity protein n=1 Tax=Alicyclobacillus sp. SO9 TaxID=2665646 RepID=UPI0018E7ADF9|nr:hypothetical protein [Alicyclobacillus sp. SO9]QQE80615.1 hypothetical protein GI364_09565 [Alicyclobacillus sp. SO9]